MLKIKYKDMVKVFKNKSELIKYIMLDEDNLSKYWVYLEDEKLRYQNCNIVKNKILCKISLYSWTNKQLVNYFLPDFDIIK